MISFTEFPRLPRKRLESIWVFIQSRAPNGLPEQRSIGLPSTLPHPCAVYLVAPSQAVNSRLWNSPQKRELLLNIPPVIHEITAVKQHHIEDLKIEIARNQETLYATRQETEEVLSVIDANLATQYKRLQSLFNKVKSLAEPFINSPSLRSSEIVNIVVLPPPPPPVYEDMTIAQLKDKLTSLKQRVGGRKADLIERLKSATQEQEDESYHNLFEALSCQEPRYDVVLETFQSVENSPQYAIEARGEAKSKNHHKRYPALLIIFFQKIGKSGWPPANGLLGTIGPLQPISVASTPV